MTLMEAFIADAVKRFQEPEKRGVPKGTAIGASKSKFIASLHSLKNHELLKIAELSDVSYGVLRKWRTEDSFKNLIFKSQGDFVNNYFWHFIVNEIDGILNLVPRNHGYSKLKPIELEEGLADILTYSSEIKSTFAKQLVRYIEKYGIEKFLDSSHRIIYMLENWMEPELNREILKALASSSNEFFHNTLHLSSVSETDFKKALACSDFIFKVSITT